MKNLMFFQHQNIRAAMDQRDETERNWDMIILNKNMEY